MKFLPCSFSYSLPCSRVLLASVVRIWLCLLRAGKYDERIYVIYVDRLLGRDAGALGRFE